jgi:hypothetical protein
VSPSVMVASEAQQGPAMTKRKNATVKRMMSTVVDAVAAPLRRRSAVEVKGVQTYEVSPSELAELSARAASIELNKRKIENACRLAVASRDGEPSSAAARRPRCLTVRAASECAVLTSHGSGLVR